MRVGYETLVEALQLDQQRASVKHVRRRPGSLHTLGGFTPGAARTRGQRHHDRATHHIYRGIKQARRRHHPLVAGDGRIARKAYYLAARPTPSCVAGESKGCPWGAQGVT